RPVRRARRGGDAGVRPPARQRRKHGIDRAVARTSRPSLDGRQVVRTTRSSTLAGLGVTAALAVALSASNARAYSFIDEIPEDPCARARSFDPQDSSLTAQRARRACRLAALDRRLADERQKTLATEQNARDAAVEKWFVATQPSRVLHPMAIELYGGSGIVNYGLAFSWDVLRNVEIAARAGRREMSCADQFSGTGADCTRTTLGAGVRWILIDRDFSPFVG